MPRLRNAFRVPDARRPVALVSRVQRRRPAEEAVGVRRAVEHARQIVLRSPDAGLRIVRRSARARGLLAELSVARNSESGMENLEFWDGRNLARAVIVIRKRAGGD